jgi:hypothetical protein
MADTCASVGFVAAVVAAPFAAEGLGSAAGLAVVVSVLGAAAGAAAGAASLFAGSLFGAADASIAFTALWHPDDRLDMFLARHCSAASPPGVTLEQCAMKSERHADLTASFWASLGPCANDGAATATIAAVKIAQSAVSRLNVSNI